MSDHDDASKSYYTSLDPHTLAGDADIDAGTEASHPSTRAGALSDADQRAQDLRAMQEQSGRTSQVIADRESDVSAAVWPARCAQVGCECLRCSLPPCVFIRARACLCMAQSYPFHNLFASSLPLFSVSQAPIPKEAGLAHRRCTRWQRVCGGGSGQ